MISIYKNNIVMVFTDESQKKLQDTLANVLEELRIVASGDVVTEVDVECCKVAIASLQMLFGELFKKEEKESLAKRMANHYNEPMIYHAHTVGYKELESLGCDTWEEFLDELGKQDLSCKYNSQHDCYVIG
ncbi:MAG: hypothetical protein II453_18435 [Alphaproteobacteria bacterium]|nr:hypothetical protein [Alphaproteobacteria bacterium]